MEAVVSLVWVVLVDVTEEVGPEVGIRDMRAGIAVAGVSVQVVRTSWGQLSALWSLWPGSGAR